MAKSAATIVSEIKEYVRGQGGNYSDWYGGIAAKPRVRLFTDHKVDEKNGAWIYAQATSSDEARNAEDRLFELGMKGGPGGGDDDTDFVYAYKITSYTKE